MIDHRLRQQQIVEKEYLHLVEAGINQEQWILGWKQRKWPAKARYFYALQGVYVGKQETPVTSEKSE